ncbi:unnamed protein product [Ixodes hexagonus]
MLIYKFTTYGKDFVKSCGMSPDSYVQMALQLALYKLRQRPSATYEGVSTRTFLQGRTDSVRCTTSESLSFCRVFESSHSSLDEKEAALRTAVEKHKRAANHVTMRCEAVVLPCPYGCYRTYYNIRPDSFIFGLSGSTSGCDKPTALFKEALQQSLTEMKECISSSCPRK